MTIGHKPRAAIQSWLGQPLPRPLTGRLRDDGGRRPHDHQPPILDHADDSVGADAIGPEVALVAVQGLAELAWVADRDHPLL